MFKDHPFSWHKLKNYIPKIKQLLFLNPFDYRHNPGLILKITLCSELLHNFTEKLLKLKNSESGSFFSLKRFSVFDWIQIIVAVAGEFRKTMEPSHNTGQIPFQIWGQYHQKLAFSIFFFTYCTTLFILKKSVCTSPCLSLSPTSHSQTPSPCIYLTATCHVDYQKKYFSCMLIY